VKTWQQLPGENLAKWKVQQKIYCLETGKGEKAG